MHGRVVYDRKRVPWTFRALYKAHEEVFLPWQDDFWRISGFPMLVPGNETALWRNPYKNRYGEGTGEYKTLPEALDTYWTMLKTWYSRTLDMAISADNFLMPRFEELNMEYRPVIEV